MHPQGRNGSWPIRLALWRIKRMPRRRPFVTRILGPPLHVIDSRSFYYSYREIMLRGLYDFPSDEPSPRIIDGGANIGLSVIRFKQLHPTAVVTAFEPDDQAFDALQRNIESFGLQDVQLRREAIWTSNGHQAFFREGADAGRLGKPHRGEVPRAVPTQRLRPLLEEPLDMLKLDIEGAEFDVLADCRDQLQQVRRVLVEYHSFVDREQELCELLQILRDAGFRVQLASQLGSPRPFVQVRPELGIDSSVNVFAYRDSRIVPAD